MPVSSSKKKGLGRGFESLIPTDLLDESFDPTADQDQRVSELRQIKLDKVFADPNQPRRKFDEVELEELAMSIKEHGVLQPIIVTPIGDRFQIVAGERRFRASKIAELDRIPALVRTLSGQRQLEVSLIENLQRKDLNVIETATAYQKLHTQFNMSLEEIGKRVGNSSIGAVSNKLRLLKLPSSVRELLVNNEITEGQVRPLIAFEPDFIESIVAKIIKENWSARKVEQFAVDYKTNKKANLPPDRRIREQPYKKQLDNIISHLKTDVHITTNSYGSGRITIKFKNEEEFNRIQKMLSDEN